MGGVCAKHLAQSGTAQAEEVRNDAEQILRETARDMQSDQTDHQRAEKSQGRARADQGDRWARASSSHGAGRRS